MKQRREPQAGKQVSLLIELSRRGWSDDTVDEILRHMPPLKNSDWKKQEEAINRIAYAKGEKDYIAYKERMMEIEGLGRF